MKGEETFGEFVQYRWLLGIKKSELEELEEGSIVYLQEKIADFRILESIGYLTMVAGFLLVLLPIALYNKPPTLLGVIASLILSIGGFLVALIHGVARIRAEETLKNVLKKSKL